MGPIASYPRRPITTAVLAGAVLVAAPLFLVAPGAAAPPGADLELGESAGSLVTERDVADIAPGLELTTFSRLESEGWTAGSVLVADLATDGLSIDYQYSGAVTEPQTVRGMAEASGATAAINGDFYDIDRSFAPIGVGVDRTDGLVSSPIGNHTNAVAVDHGGLAHLAEVLLEGAVSSTAGELSLSGVNTSAIPLGGIGLYTSTWGKYPRGNAVGGAADVIEVTVVDGAVVDVTDVPGEGPISDNEFILVGRENGAQALQDLPIGSEVEVTYAPRADFGEVAVALAEPDVDPGRVRVLRHVLEGLQDAEVHRRHRALGYWFDPAGRQCDAAATGPSRDPGSQKHHCSGDRVRPVRSQQYAG
jgi:hypothetical protein